MADNLGLPKSAESSRSSFVALTQNYWLQIRIAIISLLALTIFFQDLYIIGSEAASSDYYNYVLVIPFLSGYLIYLERKRLAAIMSLQDDARRTNLNLAIGISALLVATVLYSYGSGTTYALDYHLLALEIFLGAAIILLFNRKTLWLLSVPLLLFIAALPSINQFGLSFWLAMSWMSAVPAQWILAHIIGLNVVITLPSQNIPTLSLTTAAGASYSFEIGVASSGIYSVIGFTLFAAFLGYISKGSLWKKLALFIAAYPVLVLINILREVILVSVANLWGYFAFEAFHATSGIVLVFFVTVLILVIGERFLKLNFLPSQKPKAACLWCNQELKDGHIFCSNCGKFLHGAKRRFSVRDAYSIGALLIVTVILVSTLAPAIVSASAPTTAPIQSISGTQADSLLPKVPGWNLTFVYRDTQAQDALDQAAALIYTYTQTANTSAHPITLDIIVQVSGGQHTPETSLVVYPILFGQHGVKVLTDGGIQILKQPYLVGTFFAYNQSGTTAAYLYWITRAVFNFGTYSAVQNVEISIWQQASYLVSMGAISSTTDLSGISQVYMPIAQAIARYWQPISTNSAIQTVFQRYSALMGGLALFPAVIVGGEIYTNRRKDVKSTKSVYGRLASSRNTPLLESVKLAYTKENIWFNGIKKSKPPTTDQILAAYKIKTGQDISLVDAIKELTYFEHLGLLKRDIIKDDTGEPTQVWKTL